MRNENVSKLWLNISLNFFVKKTGIKDFKNPKIDLKTKPKVSSMVDQLVIKYLSTKGKLDPMGGLYCFYCFCVQTKLEPLLLVHLTH